MWCRMFAPYDQYRETEILSSSPAKLVQMLYELGIRSIASARVCCREGDILSRGRHINKAFDVFTELQNGLDFERGGEIAGNYARLYDYCQRRLLEAHAKQSEPILAEVESLLVDMKDAWQTVVALESNELAGAAAWIHADSASREEAILGSSERITCFA